MGIQIKRDMKIRVVVSLALTVFVAALVYWRWIFQWGILTVGDWGFYFSQSQKSLMMLPSIWDYSSLGQVNVNSSASIVTMIWGLLAHIINFALVERVLFMWPIVSLLCLGGDWFIYNQIRSPIAASIGALVMLLNMPYLILSNGELTLLMGMVLTPVVIVLFQRMLERSSIKYAIIAGLAATLLGLYEFRIFYILVWVLLFYLIYYVIIIDHKATIRNVGTSIGLASMGLGVVILLNSFWIIGLGKLNQFAANSIFATGLFGSSFLNTSEAVALFSPWWTGSKPSVFIVQSIPLLEWIIPFLALLGLYLNRKTPRIVFFGFIAALGILLTKQQAPPFTSLYFWLFTHLPGFNAFREASKFYVLIVIGYSVLIAALVDWLWRNWRNVYWQKITTYGATALVAVIFLLNGKPYINGSIQSLYVARNVPADYELISKLLVSQDQFFRTTWLPSASRWGFHSPTHPSISLPTLTNGNLAAIVNDIPASHSASSEIASTALLAEPFAKELFDATSSKYFIVPLRDTANDDDFFGNQDRQFYIDAFSALPWLKRVSIGTKQVAIYENQGYTPYISALTSVTNLASLLNLNNKYEFITQTLESSFAFAPSTSTSPGRSLEDPFEGPERSNVQKNTMFSTISNPLGKTAYINTAYATLAYQVVDDTLSFERRINIDLLANGKSIGPQTDNTQIIDSTPLDPSVSYLLAQGNDLTPIDPTNPVKQDLGTVTVAPTVYGIEGGNQVNDSQLESGLWRPVVEDCNDYDNSPIINQSIVNDDLQPNKVLQLTSIRHIACTGPDPVNVTPGKRLMVSFDYRVVQGKETAYQLIWEGQNNTIVRQYLPVTDSGWHSLDQLVTVPANATKLRLRLEALPNGEQSRPEGIVHYTNINISSLMAVETPPVNVNPQYAKIEIPPDTKQLSVNDSQLTGKNLIPNPSFESGLWQKTVGDCNNSGDGVLNMSLDIHDKSQGKQSLQLSVRRDIACTGPSPINVQENHVYLLSFDYESPNSKSASYSLTFNDPNDTALNNNIPITDKGWHTFNQTFTVPFGATEASLTVSADAADPPTTTIINRYDNFRLVEIPDVAGQYYITSGGGQTLHAPSKITYTLVNPTKKLVHITSATTPFYLAMSEAYHPQWRLELANSKSQGGLASWIPWIHPDPVPSKDHFDLDDFLNGWYVDPAALCKSHPVGCTINANGSYSLELIAEFAPQRWFYVGLVISVLTLLACLAYLGWCWRRRWGLAIQWTSRHIGSPQAWMRMVARKASPIDGINRKRPK
jgi:hypothetical protein